MAIQSAGRGRDTHLIKITLGYENGTRKRLYHTETFKGTKKEARLREAELKIQHRRKEFAVPSGMTFRECFEQYCGEVKSRLSLNCFNTYETFVKRYLLSSIGNKKLKELRKNDFQEVYDVASTRGLSPATIRTLHVAVRAFITWAMGKRLMGEDILKGVTLPKIPKVRPEFLTYEETRAFLEVAPEYFYGNAFKFQLLTGLRNQELLALMWEDINFETSTVLIRRACIWVRGFNGFKSTKTNEERTLALDSQTINFLKSLKATQEEQIKSRESHGFLYGDERLVFCTQSGHVPDAAAVRYHFKQILKRIGITRRFRWYGLRHTHATHLLDVMGANPKMIANRLGHSVEMLFRIYGHEMPDQQREALSKISSRIKH